MLSNEALRASCALRGELGPVCIETCLSVSFVAFTLDRAARHVCICPHAHAHAHTHMNTCRQGTQSAIRHTRKSCLVCLISADSDLKQGCRHCEQIQTHGVYKQGALAHKGSLNGHMERSVPTSSKDAGTDSCASAAFGTVEVAPCVSSFAPAQQQQPHTPHEPHVRPWHTSGILGAEDRAAVCVCCVCVWCVHLYAPHALPLGTATVGLGPCILRSAASTNAPVASSSFEFKFKSVCGSDSTTCAAVWTC